MSHTNARRFFSALLIAGLCIAPAAVAQNLADADLGSNGLYFTTKSFDNGFTLTIAAPDGEIYKGAFAAGETPGFSLGDIDATPDGTYQWELRPVAPARDRDKDAAPAASSKRVVSGTFLVQGGSIVTGGEEASQVTTKAAGPLAKAQVITQDQVVQGSQCVGIDCSSSESFGFDTIRLKENNLRIKFDDTSSSASFPGNDWQLTANDSSNGGANKFSIDDVTGGKTPFTVLAGAPNNALFIRDDGRIGMGTSTPAVNAHIVEGNTPTVRLEQDGSSGFTPQSWDLAGNETNFFLRDVTNSSKLPFRVKPGAPTDSIYVAADGDVGFGTDSPTANLHVKDSQGTTELFLEETITSVAARSLLKMSNKGNVRIELIDTNASANGTWFVSNNSGSMNLSAKDTGGPEFELAADGTLKIGPGGGEVFTLDSSGNLDISGSLTQASDRNIKTDFETLDSKEILSKLAALEILGWRYKHDTEDIRHIGPMAQDFYAAFGLNGTDTGIASVDTTGVAFAAIQGLNAELEAKTDRVEALESQNTELANRLAALEAMVAAIAGSAE